MKTIHKQNRIAASLSWAPVFKTIVHHTYAEREWAYDRHFCLKTLDSGSSPE